MIFPGQVSAFSKTANSVIYRGKLFELGSYPMANGTTFSLSESEFDNEVLPAFSAVPTELEHYESVNREPNILTGKTGRLVSMQRDGAEIFGEVELPNWLAQECGDTPVGVSLAFGKDKRVIRAGLVLEPRFSDTQLVAAFSAAQAPLETPKQNKMNTLLYLQGVIAGLLGNTPAAESVTGAETHGEPVTPAFSKQSAPAQDPALVAELEATKKRNAELETANRQREEVAVAAFALQYAEAEAAAFRAYPEEVPLLAEELKQAVLDDNASEVSAFSANAIREGVRVKRIRDRQAARTPFNAQKLEGKHKVYNPGAKNPAMTEERKLELLALAGPVGAEIAKESK